jgi:hypothetical protein
VNGNGYIRIQKDVALDAIIPMGAFNGVYDLAALLLCASFEIEKAYTYSLQ